MTRSLGNIEGRVGLSRREAGAPSTGREEEEEGGAAGWERRVSKKTKSKEKHYLGTASLDFDGRTGVLSRTRGFRAFSNRDWNLLNVRVRAGWKAFGVAGGGFWRDKRTGSLAQGASSTSLDLGSLHIQRTDAIPPEASIALAEKQD